MLAVEHFDLSVWTSNITNFECEILSDEQFFNCKSLTFQFIIMLGCGPRLYVKLTVENNKDFILGQMIPKIKMRAKQFGFDESLDYHTEIEA